MIDVKIGFIDYNLLALRTLALCTQNYDWSRRCVFSALYPAAILNLTVLRAIFESWGEI